MIKTIVFALVVAGGGVLAGCATTGGSTVSLSSTRPAIDTTATVTVRQANQPQSYRVFPGDEANGTPNYGPFPQ
jgi:hypothetical protein